MKPSPPKGDHGARAGASIALALVVLLAAAPLSAALFFVSKDGKLGEILGQTLVSPATLRALGFGLKQAGLSSLFALALGLPGAWFVARFDFPGKRFFRALAAVPFCVPPILVVLAFVLFYGRGGFANAFLMRLFSLSNPPLRFLYSLEGLVLVHGFYNFPVVLETVGSVWARLPRDREEAAKTLGAGPCRAFRTGTLPSLWPSIVQATSLVFLFCFFSFIVVLVFGPLGGTTLEVEIYRAARFDADPATASALALIETATAIAIVLLLQIGRSRNNAVMRNAGLAVPAEKPKGRSLFFLILFALCILVFFIGPLLSLVIQAFMVRRGMAGTWHFGIGNFGRLLGGSDCLLLQAILDSLASALPAALISTALGTVIALFIRRAKAGSIVEAALSLPLAVSAVVTALGWSFLMPGGNPFLVSLVLAVSALPFALRGVASSLATLEKNPPLAARTMGAGRIRAAFEIELPAIAPAVLSSAAFSFSIAVGDASIPLLLGRGDFQPLPLLIYRLVASYRFPEACAAGLVLALLGGFVFFLKDRGNGRP